MDKLSPEVRAAEKDVDTAYKSNPLTNRKLTEAIWYLLAVFEIELKWFLDPAEPRELMEKTKEIKKGISQLLTLKQAIEQHDPKILDSLEIGPDYSIGLAVVSANWICYSDAQDIGVAVIREHHLVRKLVTTTSF